MTKSRLAIFIDSFMLSASISVVAYAWINKLVKHNLISLFIALIIFAIIFYFTKKLANNSINKKNLKADELKFAQNCIEYLSLNKTSCLNYFKNLLDAKTCGNFLQKQNNIYYFDYNKEISDTATISLCLNKLKQTKAEKCYLFTSGTTEKVEKMLINYPQIAVVNNYDAFLLMKKYEKYPISYQKNAKINKNKYKNVLKGLFERKKAKPYLIYGTLLILLSLIFPFSYLYLFLGSLMVVFGAISLFVKTIEPKDILS